MQGGEPVTFWTMTPYMTRIAAEGLRRRSAQDARLAAILNANAYHGHDLPSVDEMTNPPKRPSPAAVADKLRAAFMPMVKSDA